MINLNISPVREIAHFIACEGTQAVLAKVVFGTPGGCAGCFISLEKVNKDLTFKSYTRKI